MMGSCGDSRERADAGSGAPVVAHDHDKPTAPFDVAVVGGGPAGSSTAALLASAGRRVALFERDRFPRDKLCGEFLSGETQRLLETLGSFGDIRARGPAKIRKARFTTASGRQLESDLPAEGLGLDRRALDEILFQNAGRLGVVTFPAAEVLGVGAPGGEVGSVPGSGVWLDVRCLQPDGHRTTHRFEAGWVVGAHGRRDRLDRLLQRRFLDRPHAFVGFKRHMRATAGAAGHTLLRLLADHVEVHTFAGGYCGLSLIQTGEVNVCMLVEKRFLTPLRSTRWESLVESLSAASPSLRSRFEALEPSDDVIHAVGQVPFCDKERALWPCLFVGDAAGMITPLCGDGQAMAVHSGILLGSLLAEAPFRPSREQFAQTARKWDRIWRREFQSRIRIGRGMQRLLLRSRSADILLGTLDWLPPLRRYLVRATRGEA